MKRPIMFLPLLLVMALAAMGVGYGLWFENLNISGTVHTGSVEVGWKKPPTCNDNEPPNPNATLGKDVGNTSGWIDISDPDIIHFQIDNGYPQYEGDCQLTYESIGSVPVRVESVTITPDLTSGLNNCTTHVLGGGTTVVTCDELEITWANGLCSQLHQGDFHSGSLWATVLQPAEEEHQYKFDMTIQFNQYNESACP